MILGKAVLRPCEGVVPARKIAILGKIVDLIHHVGSVTDAGRGSATGPGLKVGSGGAVRRGQRAGLLPSPNAPAICGNGCAQGDALTSKCSLIILGAGPDRVRLGGSDDQAWKRRRVVAVSASPAFI